MPYKVRGETLNPKTITTINLNKKGDRVILGLTAFNSKREPVFLVAQYQKRNGIQFTTGQRIICNLKAEQHKPDSGYMFKNFHQFKFGVVGLGQAVPLFGHQGAHSVSDMQPASIINYSNYRIWYTFAPSKKINLVNYQVNHRN